MSRIQQGSLLKLKRKSGPDVWVLRWYDETSGTRTYRKRTLGNVIRYPHLRDAERAADALRNTINSEFIVPETIAELVTHYREHELTEEKKAYATIEANTHYLTNHIVPKWGAMYLHDVRTVDVELWLHSLVFAPGTRSKIRNIMSAVFNHAMRYEWMDRNPISKVRTSAKRLREPDVLTPAEFAALIPELELRERAMVMLAGRTGLRRSELVALTWRDMDLELMQVVRAQSLRRHQDRSEPQASPAPSFRSEEPPGMAERFALSGRGRFHLSIHSSRRQTTVVPGHLAQEGHPARSDTGRHCGQGNRMA
jgi:Phage integrase family